MPHVIQTQVDCNTAQEFLDALSPIGSIFRNVKLDAPWLFRGQGQDYPLLPSALRKTSKLVLLTHRDISDHSERRRAEQDIVIRFFEIADKRGLILPDDSQQLRSALETLRSSNYHVVAYEWDVGNVALSLIALAQHYGVPTRLLDWTRQAFIAAFFAAEDALNPADNLDPSSRLVVWALYFPELGKHSAMHKVNDPIRIVTAPSATNPNLKAQQGVFTLLHHHHAMDFARGTAIPMEQMLEDLARKAEPEKDAADALVVNCKLQKFTLPVSEARELLYFLAKLDITPSAVYPGYHSIIRDLQMQTYYPS